MTAKQQQRIAAAARRLDAHKARYRRMVERASGGRRHHQGCLYGGLLQGLASTFDGGPCWCGIEEACHPHACVWDGKACAGGTYERGE